MTKIMLTGTLSCAETDIDIVLDLMADHIRQSRAEPGCLECEVWQDELTLTKFHVSEIFRDQAAFEHHQDRSSGSDWGRATAHMSRDFAVSQST